MRWMVRICLLGGETVRVTVRDRASRKTRFYGGGARPCRRRCCEHFRVRILALRPPVALCSQLRPCRLQAIIRGGNTTGRTGGHKPDGSRTLSEIIDHQLAGFLGTAPVPFLDEGDISMSNLRFSAVGRHRTMRDMLSASRWWKRGMTGPFSPEDGQHGLEVLRRISNPTAIITDIQHYLPRLDGFRLQYDPRSAAH